MNTLMRTGPTSLDFSIALLIPTFTIVSIAYFLRKFSRRVSPTIPYACEESIFSRFRVPLEYSKDPAVFLNKVRKKQGDVFCVDLFAVKIVYLVGVEGNRDILRASEDTVSFWENAKWAFGPVMDWTFEYPGWMSPSVKILKTGLQRLDRSASGAPICMSITSDFFEKAAEQGSMPLFQSISHLVLSYLLVLVMGEDFYKRHRKELIPLLSRFERELQNPILRITPSTFWRFTSPGRFLFDVADRFDKMALTELKNIIDNPEQHSGRDDYFYNLVSHLDDKFAPVYGRHTLGIVFGGHANVAMSIPWLLLHAKRVPGALERIRSEAILPRTERKPYIDACFRETGRLYTNIAMMRVTKKTVSLCGHVIPKGTLVACSPGATQHADCNEEDKAYGIFSNARHWHPERFLNDPDAYARWFQSAQFVHFGLGLHACPGERLAKTMIYDFFLKGWAEYDMEVVSGLEEGIKGLDGVGAEAAWTEENMGTPSIRGFDISVKVQRRALRSH